MSLKEPDPLTYRDAGVDIDRGNRLVDAIKSIAARTRRPEVLAGIGGFGALFEVPVDRYKAPVLVSGADGVGTKLKLAVQAGTHDTIGIDLVAMCANDVLVLGAEPLFFLDYYASGTLDVDVARDVVAGIGRGCELAGAALIGGETAEMPGMYEGGDYELAGFCVGVVEKDRIIDGSRVSVGDVLVGLPSSGPHSNGYSLIRKVIAGSGTDLAQAFHGRTLAETLLEPTRIYVKPVLEVIRQVDVHAITHITGGGFVENIPRVLPAGLRVRLDLSGVSRPPIFDWLQDTGNIEDREMYRVFNCGIGMILCVSPKDVQRVMGILATNDLQPREMGVVETARPGEPLVVL